MEVVVGDAPTVFTLEQNYPNPFNPTTTIEFSVNETGPAILKIYNLLGQEVAELFAQNAESGKMYSTVFDAHSLSSGIYIAQLRSHGTMVTNKMLLQK